MSDEQLQSTPYEIKPGEPRLTGLLALCGPLTWKVHRSGETVEVVIDARSMRRQIKIMTVFAFVAPAFWAGGVMWLTNPAPSAWWALGELVGTIGVLCGVGWMRANLNRSLRAGPLVRFASQSDLEFPRFGRTVLRADAIRWEVVHGAWVRARGPYDSVRLVGDDPIWELQLVYRQGNFEMVQPLVGAASKRQIEGIAQDLSEASGISWNVVEEPLSVWRNPFEANTLDKAK